MSDFGFKLALPGIDVNRATPEQCAIHSSYPHPKINKRAANPHRGLVELIFNSTYAVGDTVLYTLDHDYGYTPMNWAVITQTDSGIGVFGFQPYTSGLFSVDVRTGAKNLQIVATQLAVPALIQMTLLVSFAIFADNGAKND